MAVQVPPAPAESDPDIDAGVIEDARARQRKHRNIGVAAIVTAATVAAVIVLIGSGSPTGRRTGRRTQPSGSGVTRRQGQTLSVRRPTAVAVGPDGDLYIGDSARQQILRRLPNGHFTVIAGTGVGGYSGDGGRATRAEIKDPGSMVITPAGVLYFAQAGTTSLAGGFTDTVIREVTPGGKITTVAGQHPSCHATPHNSDSIPARSVQLNGAQLTIGKNGLLDVSSTICPNARHFGSFLQLTASARFARTSADSIPDASGYCGGGVAGAGFIAFGCESGAERGPRLMVVRSDGSSKSYPNEGSQANEMSVSDGTVVASHNGAIVKVGVDRLQTLATERQIESLIPGTIDVMGDGGIAVDHHGVVYSIESLLTRPHGCTSVIVRISPKSRIRALWRSAPNQICF
jgi:hypothetical protein